MVEIEEQRMIFEIRERAALNSNLLQAIARGDRRKEIFRDERGRWKFLGYLAEGGERFRVKVYRQPASNVGHNHYFSPIGHNMPTAEHRC
jgi:hypothetical protein